MIIKTNQGFIVRPSGEDIFDLLPKLKFFLKKFTTYRLIVDKKNRTKKLEVDRTFYLQDLRNSRLYFIDTVYKQFKGYFKREITEELIREDYDVRELGNVDINPKYLPREYQKKYIEIITKTKLPRILVDLQTGKGKSFIATYSAVKRGKVFGFLLLPRYIDKWIKDITEYTTLREDEIYVVRGSGSLNALAYLIEEELSKYKVFIFSLTTMREYLSNYLDINEEFRYELEPSELLPFLGIETLISDEIHQEFHNVFNLTLLLDPKFLLGLSATLLPRDNREKEIQESFFPEDYRVSNIIKYDRYIDVVAVEYNLVNPNRYKRVETSRGYSHTKFEQTLMKYKLTLKSYFELIYALLMRYYVKPKKEGDKALIFVTTVELAKKLRDYLRSKLPDLKIEKYTSEDPYDILFNSDVIISTLGSAGTGVDIPNLRVVIQTVLIKSAKTNIQALGRLRKLNDRNVTFIYIFSPDIRKHLEYNRERIDVFRDRVRSLKFVRYHKLI